MSLSRTFRGGPQWWHDLRAAARALWRRPGAHVLTVAIMALGLGAAGAMYGVVRPLLLSPLPYRAPERLVYVWETDLRNDELRGGASYPDWLDWRARSRSFEAVSAYQRDTFNARRDGAEPERVTGLDAEHGLFDVLGTSPLLGRPLQASDDVQNAPPVALLGYEYWQRRYGGDRAALGRTIELDGRRHEIVGIMPPARGWALNPDVWRPLLPALGQFLEQRGVHNLRTVARLRSGATIAAADAEMRALMATMEREHPDSNAGRSATVVGMHGQFVESLSRPLYLLSATVALLLVLTCSNVLGLLLARTSTREAELALRASLGAPALRLARQLTFEALLLGLAGGVAGVALSQSALRLVAALNPIPGLDVSLWRADGPVLSFGLVLCLVMALAAGALPAWAGSRVAPARVVAATGRGSQSGARGGGIRQALVSIQVALSLAMLLATAVLVRSYVLLGAVDLGLHAESIVTIGIKLPEAKYPMPALSEYPHWPAVVEVERRLLEQVGRAPGVRAAALSMQAPLTHGWTTQVDIDGRAPNPGGAPDEWQMRAVTPGYFSALGVPVIAGRDLSGADREGAPDVVLINASAARRYFPGTDPLGKRLTFWGKSREIVGVVGDVRTDGVGQPPAPAIHPSLAQVPFSDLTAVVRVDGDPRALLPLLTQAVWAAEPDAVPYDAGPLAEVAARLLAPQRFALGIAAMLALVALTLALSGIAGVVAFEVARRRAEIAVRVALGASGYRVLQLLMRRSLALVLGGALCGLALYLAAAGWLQDYLYQVSPRDPGVLAIVLGLLSAVALAASALPARRALYITPADVLKDC